MFDHEDGDNTLIETVINLCRTTRRHVTEYKTNKKQTPWPLVRKRTILTERPPLLGEI
jgi:hypothetical protein